MPSTSKIYSLKSIFWRRFRIRTSSNFTISTRLWIICILLRSCVRMEICLGCSIRRGNCPRGKLRHISRISWMEQNIYIKMVSSTEIWSLPTFYWSRGFVNWVTLVSPKVCSRMKPSWNQWSVLRFTCLHKSWKRQNTLRNQICGLSDSSTTKCFMGKPHGPLRTSLNWSMASTIKKWVLQLMCLRSQKIS